MVYVFAIVSRLISLTETISNKYLGGLSGDNYYFLDDILEFDPLSGQWKEVEVAKGDVAKMFQERYYHAVSVIKFSEVEQFCNSGE